MKRIAITLAASSALLATLAALGLGAPLAPKDVKVEGMKVTIVPADQAVEIEPLAVTHRQADGTLAVVKPGWDPRKSFVLPGTAWVYRVLLPGSLVVTLADRPDQKLVEGTDYTVNPKWGTIGALESSKVPPGTKLHFEYDCTKSRIDLVERTPDGKIVVRKGTEDMTQPLLPEPTPGSTPLLSVYLANATTSLAMENINLIDPAYNGVPPVSGTASLKGLKARLAEGKPITIAFLGDSITAQQPKDFRDGLGSFVDRFAKHLETAYPDRKVVVTPRDAVVPPAEKQIVIVKAGVGGDDTPRALKRIDADVLAHKPDAVVIMLGVNDENRRGDGNSVPVPQYKANLAKIVEKVQAAGADAIVMTTSMKNLNWESTVGNLNEYAAAAREVAADRKACLVDNFKAWEELPRRGYNYMVFLGNCLNHPVDLGHDLFFRGLKAAFETE